MTFFLHTSTSCSCCDWCLNIMVGMDLFLIPSGKSTPAVQSTPRNDTKQPDIPEATEIVARGVARWPIIGGYLC
jgi:hypothetical protein